MKKILLFGVSQTAELAHYYLTNDTEYQVAAFVVTDNYKTQEKFMGLPIVSFEKIRQSHPPSKYDLFAPMMASNVNRARREVFDAGKSMGYDFISYISSHSTILTNDIGENCFILEDNTIQPFVSIGDNCVLWSGNHIGHHSRLSHSLFVTSHCVISGNCQIGAFSYIGVNASLKEKTILAEGTMVTMASTVTSNRSKPYCVISGNPGEVHPRLNSNILLK